MNANSWNKVKKHVYRAFSGESLTCSGSLPTAEGYIRATPPAEATPGNFPRMLAYPVTCSGMLLETIESYFFLTRTG